MSGLETLRLLTILIRTLYWLVCSFFMINEFKCGINPAIAAAGKSVWTAYLSYRCFYFIISSGIEDLYCWYQRLLFNQLVLLALILWNFLSLIFRVNAVLVGCEVGKFSISISWQTVAQFSCVILWNIDVALTGFRYSWDGVVVNQLRLLISLLLEGCFHIRAIVL